MDNQQPSPHGSASRENRSDQSERSKKSNHLSGESQHSPSTGRSVTATISREREANNHRSPTDDVEEIEQTEEIKPSSQEAPKPVSKETSSTNQAPLPDSEKQASHPNSHQSDRPSPPQISVQHSQNNSAHTRDVSSLEPLTHPVRPVHQGDQDRKNEEIPESTQKTSPPAHQSRDISSLDPFHEPFTHPVRPQPKKVLGEGDSQPNTRESQRNREAFNTPPESHTPVGHSREKAERHHPSKDNEVEEELILETDTRFIPPPTVDDWTDELLPEDSHTDENKMKSKKSRRESLNNKHGKVDGAATTGNSENTRVKQKGSSIENKHDSQQAQQAPGHQPTRPQRANDPPGFTIRQPNDEKLPPLNAHRQGLITKKYANYYFSNDRVQQNLPQINTSKLSDSIEAIHNIQHNEKNRGLYLQTIRNAIKRLRYLRHYDSLEAHQAIYMLVFSATRQLSTDIGTIMAEEKSAEILVNMLKKLTSSNVFMTDITWAVTSGILVIMSDYSHKNNVFARELADAGAIPVLLFSLQHKPVAQLMGSNKNVNDLIILCIATLYSISCVPETDFHFDKLKVSKILRTFLPSNNNVMRLLATMTMANILFDNDPTRILEETSSIKYLIEVLQEFARNIHSRRKHHRRHQSGEEGLSTSRSVGESNSQSPRDNSPTRGNLFADDQAPQQGVNLDSMELLRTLGRLAMHDGHKNELIKLGFIDIVSSFLSSHSSAEQAMAANALWSLIAGSNMGAAAAALTELTAMEETITLIRKLSERSSNQTVRSNCQALAWLIDNRDYNGSRSAAQHHPQSDNPPGGQVYISYASSSADLVGRITKKLRACGYMVHPDPAAGPDSLPLPAAIAAIEAANVVLLCCSERYKTEPRCRTEAEIVNQIRRPSVWMRMDFHLNFTGWLSSLVGHRDTLDVSGRRYSFDEGLKRLLRLMGVGGQASVGSRSEKPVFRRRTNKREIPEKTQVTQSSANSKVPRRSTRVLAMNRDNVQRWLTDIGLEQFGDRFSRYDGQMMDNLYLLHHSAPEFVCQSLSAKLDGDLDNVITFFTALNRLYD